MTRERQEEWETQRLAPFAKLAARSRGRVHPEDEHPYRTAFQRDRDRLIHSTAFRRLEYKTQVFINKAGDHYRTRLTHTIEVAQIARTLARALSLNEDLCEAIALAHDLGHPPFGHAGERVLNSVLKNAGGFEHNAQALRIVDLLERRYAGFAGLNLTMETRAGILKGHGPYKGMGEGLDDLFCIEAQIVDAADEITYCSHDLDDGIDSGLLHSEDVMKVPLWEEAERRVEQAGAALSGKPKRYPLIVHLINWQVTDLAEETLRRLREWDGATPCELVGFSAAMQDKVRSARSFLFEHLYRHPQVMRINSRCTRIVTHLFEHYVQNPKQMPPSFRERVDSWGVERAAADYISGMTDRYAEEDYRQLFGF
ncbi:MAG: deoxyguanosinetriphosphate triphosphohydrolase [bacterium]|nr:deoxyguanosinetriphosphate triphosphohydrolase [bacterium]